LNLFEPLSLCNIIGLLAQVVDATTTHYSLELLAKLKKIVLEKDKTISVGGKNGSFESNPSQVYIDR